jgi:hypothetical protein
LNQAGLLTLWLLSELSDVAFQQVPKRSARSTASRVYRSLQLSGVARVYYSRADVIYSHSWN